MENFGASRQRVYEELGQFLEVVENGGIADEYAAVMNTLPERQRLEAEALFRDYLTVFTEAKGLRMRVLQLLHEAYTVGQQDADPAES